MILNCFFTIHNWIGTETIISQEGELEMELKEGVKENGKITSIL